MSKRRSIYTSTALERVLDARTSDSRSVSATLSTIAERYDEAVRSHARDLALSTDEWLLVCEALNGLGLDGWDGSATRVRFAWPTIADAITLNGLDEKWGVDAAVLTARLCDCSYADLLALVDMAERFWLYDDAEPRELIETLLG